jgi:hypothetical protein
MPEGYPKRQADNDLNHCPAAGASPGAPAVDPSKRNFRYLPYAFTLQPPKPEIGFHVKEDAVPYRFKRRPLKSEIVNRKS